MLEADFQSIHGVDLAADIERMSLRRFLTLVRALYSSESSVWALVATGVEEHQWKPVVREAGKVLDESDGAAHLMRVFAGARKVEVVG